LNLYAPLRGPDAKFILRDRKGEKLAEVKGKMKGSAPSVYYYTLTEKGTTEIVRLRPYREHENMEQNGKVVALFYVVDVPDAKKEVLDGSR
jgi:DNA-binding PadR family transcriptional regulator